MFIKEK
jgi:hypothetical protein